jgi:hypothetical protein
MILFSQWLIETRRLQEDAYGFDFDHFDSGDGAPVDKVINLVEYIDMNFMAAMHELCELHDETSWKPWQMDKPYVHRAKALKETVDVLHFIGNMLSALGVSDEELNKVYVEKMAVNRERMLGDAGYYVLEPGVKCRECRRALDDVPRSYQDHTICQACHIKELMNA